MKYAVTKLLTWLARAYRHRAYPNFHVVRGALRAIAGEFPTTGACNCLDIGAGVCPYREKITGLWNIDIYLAIDLVPTESTDIIADARRLPLASDSIGMVVSFDVIQHIQCTDDVLREVSRVLRPGGLFIVTFPFMYSECDFRDYYRWTLSGMSFELERQGLEVVWERRRGGIFYMLGSFLLWVAQHLVPGGRSSWRTRPGVAAYLRSSLSYLLALPVIPVAWAGLLIDRVLPPVDSYMGAVMVARKKGSDSCGS